MGEREIQPRGESDVILLLSKRWIGDVNIAERILPSEPLADFSNGTEIEGCTVFPTLAEIWEDIQFFR